MNHKFTSGKAGALLTHQQLMEQYAETFEKLADKLDFELAMDQVSEKNKALYKRLIDE